MREYVSIEEIRAAYMDCCKHKRSTADCVLYQANAIMNNYELYRDLNGMTYEIGESKAFCVTRPKLREVFCAQFRDRIVHHLLSLKFGALIDEELTDNAFACRNGKGTDYGINFVRREIERVSDNYTKETWILKCDLQGFFMSIDREMLYKLLERTIKGKYHGDDVEWWMWLWRKVIMNDPARNCMRVGDLTLWNKLPKSKSLFTSNGKGLPIGNLPSQILANLLLSGFDKWVLEKIGKDGGYGRYVDDFLVISKSRKQLHAILQESREYLENNLGLTLHPRKISLQKANKGVRFTGTFIRPHRQLPNAKTVEYLFNVIRRFGNDKNLDGRRLARYVNRINSLFGLMIHKNTYRIRRKAWVMMPHKNIVYCVNMKKIRIRKDYKVKNNEQN